MDVHFAGAIAVAVLFGCIAGAATTLILRLGGVHRAGTVSCGSGSIGDVYFRHSTRSARTSPFGRMVLTGGGARFGEHRINRFISDSDHNYFGYDLRFDPDEGRAAYRLAFEPLSLQPDQFLPARLGIGGRRPEHLPLEQLPPPQILRLGHALEFNLTTADGRHKVIERIKFSKPSRGSIRRLLWSLAITHGRP
jgi:hypothetical protein